MIYHYYIIYAHKIYFHIYKINDTQNFIFDP